MDSPYIYIRVKNPADAVNLSLLDFHFCCIIKPKRMCPSTTHSLYLRMKQRCEKIRACFEKKRKTKKCLDNRYSKKEV